jgi:pimeloyl-[acyl-carrier protein] methyl ester esterase
MAAAARPAPAPMLYQERSGQGAPVVFWHGWGLNLRVFDALRAALADHWLTSAVDLPGHGRSGWARHGDGAESWANGAALLAQLLATLPPANRAAPVTTLVGWSLGGQLALRAAALAPERIARLVLIGTTPRFVRARDWPHGVPASTLHRMRQRLAQDCRGTVSDFLELQVRGSRNAAGVLQALQAAVSGQGSAQPQALAAGLALLEATDLRAQLGAVQMPTLVIAGQHDRVTPPAASAALAAALPRAAYLEIARAAHAPFLSHPEQLLPGLRAFLNGSAAP